VIEVALAIGYRSTEASIHPVRQLALVVLGGLNMDLIVKVPRLPGPGETIAGDSLLRAPGGKGANQAVAAARLGAAVSMVGRVGRDSFGRELKRTLRDNGVATRWVLGSDHSTGAALIEVDALGENSIAVAPGANAGLLPEDVPRRLIETADVVAAAVEVPLATIEEAFRLARLGGVRTVLNAAPAHALPPSLLRLTDVVICNEHELGALLGRQVAVGDEAAQARALRGASDQIVVVTLGERGALAISGDEFFEQPAFSVSVIDSTGAGDAFVGGFVNGRWWKDGVAAALRTGCAAGALATTRAGAQPSMPSLEAVQALLGR
jgi:ribokinase